MSDAHLGGDEGEQTPNLKGQVNQGKGRLWNGKTKRKQTTKKTFANYPPSKALISKSCEEVLQLSDSGDSNKSSSGLVQKQAAEMLRRRFPKETGKWPTATGKALSVTDHRGHDTHIAVRCHLTPARWLTAGIWGEESLSPSVGM